MYALETINLTKKYGSKTAVNNLNLRINQGRIFGLLGPNGAGKTTTLRMLMGLIAPTLGEAFVLDKPVGLNKQKYKENVGYLPDVPSFYNWMTAEEFLRFSGELTGIKSKELKKRVNRLLDIADLTDVKTRIGGFSRGMKQRLGIVQALINNPQVVFLDEPTSALDPIGRKEVLEMIDEFSGDINVILSTHILTDVEKVCDEVGIINRGKLIKQESITALKEKYIDSIIELQITGRNSDNLISKLEELEWVRQLERNKGKSRILVSDIDYAQYMLPKLISDYNLKLVKFEKVETTLEDIFMELVKQDED